MGAQGSEFVTYRRAGNSSAAGVGSGGGPEAEVGLGTEAL